MLQNTKGKRVKRYVPDYVVFDLETTGISATADEVIEISALRVQNGIVEDEFTSLVNPNRPIPPGASAVNHITDGMVERERGFSEVLPEFLDFAGDRVLVGHNIHSFDMKFLYRDCQKYFGKVPGNDYIDTLYFAKKVLPQLAHYRLVDLAAHYGISQEGAHRALNDCRMNQRVYECLAREFAPTEQEEERICARCGSPMKKRSGRYGEFWGCMAYPKCRYTESC